FTYTDGTLTVDKAALSVTAISKTIIYGESLPTFDGVFIGVVNNDDITVTYTSDGDGTSAGTFDITVTLNDPDNRLGNYDVTSTSGVLTVNKALLSVVANNQTITFGDPLPTLEGVLTGIVDSDNISATYATTATASSPAGTYPITVTLNDPDTKLGNYTTTITEGVLTIEPVLNVEENNVTIYPNPTENSLTIEGLEYDSYMLISLEGKEIKKAEQAEALDLSELDQGQYIIQLIKNQEVIHQQKIIKR
ncbi:MAG: MBG domain-containing protein, partial [Bacteroidota bacterium]